MQNEPDAADLLAVVGEVLIHEVVPQLTGATQHHARVAANLVAIVEREIRLAGTNDAIELERLGSLLGDEYPDDLGAARSALEASLRAGLGDDPRRFSEVWSALVDVVRSDLAVAKPDYGDWEAD